MEINKSIRKSRGFFSTAAQLVEKPGLSSSENRVSGKKQCENRRNERKKEAFHYQLASFL